MDMGDTMTMGGASSDGSPLNATGFDLTNSTQAADFLGEVLDDTQFQIDGNMYARDFWYGVVVIIGLFAITNIVQKITMRMRIRAAAANHLHPAKPSNPITQIIATTTAILREASYAQFTPVSSRFFKVPPVGTIVLLLAYLVWVLILEFASNNVKGGQHFTSLGIRAAWLAVAQVPLLILLAGKNNLIGLVSGVSYERLNVLHRWTSRVLLFLATLHVIFLHLAWNKYDLGPLEYATDSCIPTGWAVYAVLIWLNISTIGPLRNLSYEFFVVQHILSFFGFIIAVMWHLPSTALYSRVYIYIPIGLWFVDRVIRSARWAYNNIRPGRATLTAYEGGITKITVKSKQIKSWTPGSHVFLSIPKFGIGQSHPATIASIPTSHSGELVFILKSHKGFTSRILRSATTSATSLLSTKETSAPQSVVSHVALVDGPYGGSHADFAAFDTVLLIAGSTGCTFTLPLLLDIAARATSTKLPVRRVTFVWIVKNTSWTKWISAELQGAFTKLIDAGIEVEVKVFVTCDDNFTSLEDGEQSSKECGCACDKSLGPCCCVAPILDSGDENGLSQRPSNSENSEGAEVDEKGTIVRVTGGKSTSLRNSSSVLRRENFQSGRPDFYHMLDELLRVAEGETGVAVCGPLGLNSAVRKSVVMLSDERAVHKGTGAQGIYLHAEGFGW